MNKLTLLIKNMLYLVLAFGLLFFLLLTGLINSIKDSKQKRKVDDD